MNHKSFLAAAAIIGLWSVGAPADGERDNDPANVRPIPRPGVEVPANDERDLRAGLAELGEQIARLKKSRDAMTRDLVPDVEIYHRAVRCALDYNEFFAEADIEKARRLLTAGLDRATHLAAGEAPWTFATGLVVRGYVSRIDHTVQPYGLVIPASWAPDSARSFRCDVWFHGRGETLSEVNFIDQRTRQIGRYAPRNTIVLHPYGRYSNAFKFAGETDVLEALESVRGRYNVDDERISVRGFSMGGAACWQFAVHYSDLWFAANPGAGFSETPEFLKFFQKETLNPTWYERRLWNWYDCNQYALNLVHCPTVAYSGELDIQKQAADVMETALAAEKIRLRHIIGPETKHTIHPDSMVEIERRMGLLAERGRERTPRIVRFTTHTLKYNRMHWVTVDALEQHWEPARVTAYLPDSLELTAAASNVSALTFDFDAGESPFPMRRQVKIRINDQDLRGPWPSSDRSWQCHLVRAADGLWSIADRPGEGLPTTSGVRKTHGLQGPIDDALMDSFIFVRPTGTSANEALGNWAAAELDHAMTHWRQQFRGDARVKADTDITDADVRDANLVLWGDPGSNRVLQQIAERLPIQWTETEIIVGNRRFPASHHGLVLVYPNPLNPNRYVVLNSSFTYREYAYLNNARQVPKLPDWAIVDLRTPPDSLWPGKIVDADFFDEAWALKPARNAD